jgi:branched-chain amino acid transport system permease protein
VVMVLLGGLGSFWGPALGGVGLFLVNRVFWMNWGDTSAYIAILGAAIVVVVLFLPEGIAGLLRRSNRRSSVLARFVQKHREPSR